MTFIGLFREALDLLNSELWRGCSALCVRENWITLERSGARATRRTSGFPQFLVVDQREDVVVRDLLAALQEVELDDEGHPDDLAA
jgi:hypothetical protein